MGSDCRWELMLWMRNWGNVEPHEPEVPIIWICVFKASYLICTELRKCQFNCQLSLAAVTEIKARFRACTYNMNECLSLFHLLVWTTSWWKVLFSTFHIDICKVLSCAFQRNQTEQNTRSMWPWEIQEIRFCMIVLHTLCTSFPHSSRRSRFLVATLKTAKFERLSASLSGLV